MSFVAVSASPTIALRGLTDKKIGLTLSSLPPLPRFATFSVDPESLQKGRFWVTPQGPSGCYHPAVTLSTKRRFRGLSSSGTPLR
jgi:hypothetical protein